MNKKKNKELIALITLIILIVLTLILTYIRFFSIPNTNIEEKPVNNSSSNAINKALTDITTNFNNNPNVNEYKKNNNVILKASVNNYSIYISYITETTITYEFTYDNLNLNIYTSKEEETQEKFKIIYQFLIEAVQERLNNTENLDNIANEVISENITYDGLKKIETTNGIQYQIDITKRLKLEE